MSAHTRSLVTNALHQAGFVRLAPRWIRAEDLPIVQALTAACATEVEAIRGPIQRELERMPTHPDPDSLPNPQEDRDAAWAAWEASQRSFPYG